VVAAPVEQVRTQAGMLLFDPGRGTNEVMQNEEHEQMSSTPSWGNRNSKDENPGYSLSAGRQGQGGKNGESGGKLHFVRGWFGFV